MQELRTKMAKKALQDSKMGDPTKCDPNNKTEEKLKYCNDNFDTDPDLNKDCKDLD